MNGGGVIQRGTPAQTTKPVSISDGPQAPTDASGTLPYMPSGQIGSYAPQGPKIVSTGGTSVQLQPPLQYGTDPNQPMLKTPASDSASAPPWSTGMKMPPKIAPVGQATGAVSPTAVQQRGKAQPIVSAATPLPATQDPWNRRR